MSSKDITKRLRDYARDYTTTTYHDDLIREAATGIESLRQQVTLLRASVEELIPQNPLDTEHQYKVHHCALKALAATEPKP